MLSASLIKVKLLTLLSMVCMGLFSRLVLGFPMILPTSNPSFHTGGQNTEFPAAGSRPSLRFMPAPRYRQKRRRFMNDGTSREEELANFEANVSAGNFSFVGEVVDYPDESSSLTPYAKTA